MNSSRSMFTSPQLSIEEQEMLVVVATNAFRNFIESTRLIGPKGALFKSASNTSINLAHASLFHGSTIVKGCTVGDVSAYHLTAMTSTENYCRVNQCIDTKLLYTLEVPTPDHPHHYLALRWFAMASSVPMVKPRDFVVLEYLDSFQDAHGRTGWARCIHSIDHRSAPSLLESHGYVRGNIQNSGIVVYHDDVESISRANIMLLCDKKTSMASKLFVKSMIQGMFKHFDTLNERIQVYRHSMRLSQISSTASGVQRSPRSPSSQYGDNEIETADRATRKHCVFCAKRFHLFRRPETCETCHQVVCSKCMRRITKTSKHKVCMSCFMQHQCGNLAGNPFTDCLWMGDRSNRPSWAQSQASASPSLVLRSSFASTVEPAFNLYD
ncbi:hypothetical protein H310_04607 [Aphanomyces invadans]|uniref:FYVE-type domain-containing protein n=1 Tax=Aphanomyces invadans TaxID=157072 RepID=A0A024UEH8_9STRA|nr:hypothetical protein H310_04607 [Aphanomyces invadans]ETW04287.1 hypothetical protein H310_04607 [Aphanomyces invadans]|eukprot:XP_008867243.1 hypothetical protein H310_04607 [Aphanomyces invadans]